MIDSEVLSYYAEEIGKEPRRERLRDHIHEALKYSDNIDDSRIGRLSGSLGVKNLGELLKYAIIFHDVGKVFYQSRKYLRHDGRRVYLSFRGHEFLSSLVAYVFASEKSRIYEGHNYLSIVFAIFHHHHAMSIPNRCIEVKNIINSDIVRSGDYKHRIEGVLKGFLSNEDFEIASRSLSEFGTFLTGDFVGLIRHQINDALYRRANSDLFRKASMLLLDCLIACDYMAARERGDGESIFFRAISDFYNMWMRRI